MELKIDFRHFAGRNAEQIPAEVKSALAQVVHYQTPPPIKRVLQRTASKLYCRLSERSRERFSSLVKVKIDPKDMRQKLQITPDPQLHQVSEWLLQQPVLTQGSTLLLSHDVDYQQCYNFVPQMAEIEAELGVRATYHFLPRAGYKIDGSLLRRLSKLGHEVGVHGLDYDLRLAYHSRKKIGMVLSQARDILQDLLGENVTGYRNHGLRQTPELVQALIDSKFIYNSGIYPRSGATGFDMFYCWPFAYQDQKMVEIPVLWPLDTEAFRVLQLADDVALHEFTRRAKLAANLQGSVCLDLHPSIMSQRPEFLRRLIISLQALNLPSSTLGQYATALLGERASQD